MRSHAKATSAGSINGRAKGRHRRAALLVLSLFAFSALLGAGIAFASKELITYFGTPSGSGALGGQFNEPRDVGVNQTGTGPANPGDVYVADDENNRVQRFDAEGNFISAWGADVDATPSGGSDFEICTVEADCKAGVATGGNGTAAGNGAFDNPQSVAVDSDTGLVYVSDRENRRVSVYDGEGAFQRSFGFDVAQAGPGNTGAAYEICVAADGDVCKAGLAGAGVGQLGSGTQKGILGIAVSQPNGEAAAGKLFLADSGNRRVNTYDLSGAAPASFGSSTNFGLAQPRKIAVDSRGVVYASNSNNSGEIERYDSQNANGGGIGFLAPILAKNSSPATGPLLEGSNTAGGAGGVATVGLAVDPDSDGVGADTDVLYVLRDPASNFGVSAVQQLGPLNKPGLSAAPTAVDDEHGKPVGFGAANGLGLNEASGRLYLSADQLGGHRVFILGSPPVPPVVTIDPIATFTGTTATFEGEVTTHRIAGSYRFEYSQDGANWTKTPPADAPLTGGPVSHQVSASVTGLTAHTTYQVRLVASKSFNGGSATTQTSFETAAAPPSVLSTSHRLLRDTSVLLQGSINPQNEATEYSFEYVDQASYEAEGFAKATGVPVPPGEVSGAEAVAVEADVTGLTPLTGYRYRLLATNPTGTAVGPEKSFTTYSPAFHGLPDGRAYEQASPVDKNSQAITGTYATVKASPNGDAVTFTATSGIPGGEGAQGLPPYLGTRDEAGWSTQGLLPPASAGPEAQVIGWTPDLAHSFSWALQPGLGKALFARASADGSLSTVVDYTTKLMGDAAPDYAGASAEGSILFFETRAQLTPNAALGQPNLYVWERASGELRLAGVLNDGEAPAAGSFAGPYDWPRGETPATLAIGGASDDHYTQELHAISADGSRAFFTAGGNGRLYLRENPTEEQSALDVDGSCTEPDRACTIEISASQKDNGGGLGGTDANGHRPAAFMAATPDGSSVFFTSAEKLTNDATTGPEPAAPAIARADLDGSDADLGFLPAGAEGVDVDATHVYWTNPKAGTIGRAELDGSEVEPEFIAGASNPQDVAVGATHIYWTNAADGGLGTGSIGRAELDGENVDQSCITGASKPLGIDVDATYVYWANADAKYDPKKPNFQGELGRATLDCTTEINQEFIPESRARADVVVNATHIYWSRTEGSSSFVKRSKIDGTGNIDNIVEPILDGAGIPPSLALDDSHLYLANPTTSVIGRVDFDGIANPEGAENVVELIKGAANPKGLAVDSSHLYWSANQGGSSNLGNDLYRYDADTGELTDLTVDALDVSGAQVRGVLGASDDGSRAYFVANGVLDSTPNARGESAAPGDCPATLKTSGDFTCNLYLSDEGEARFIGRLDGGMEGDITNLVSTPSDVFFGYSAKTAFVSPDGASVLFSSVRQLSDYDNEGVAQLYRYRAEEDSLICVSCNPTPGVAPVGPPALGSIATPTLDTPAPAPFLSRPLSASGNRVFFESRDALVATDVNGDEGCPLVGTSTQGFPACLDVYMWEAKGTGSCQSEEQNGGCLYLLSTGDSEDPSFLADASASGEDVFLFTSEQLVGQDRDDLYDVYDARVGGGLPSQNEAPIVPCEGEGCKPGATAPPATQTPGSSTFSGPGNPVTTKPRPRCPKGKRKVRRRGKVRCVSRGNQRKTDQNRRASR